MTEAYDAYAALALYAAETKTGGRFRDGTGYYVQHVHPRVIEDQPVTDAVRRRVRDEVARYVTESGTALAPEDVTLTEVTPEEFAAVWRERMMSPFGPEPAAWVAEHHHFVGHWTPPLPEAAS